MKIGLMGNMVTKAADKASDRMHTSWRGGMP